MLSARHNLIITLTTLAIGGCASTPRDLEPIRAAGVASPTSYDDRPWATVVRENVKDDLVDYAHLAAHRDSLDAYLRMVAELGPNRTPAQFKTRDARTAYYINAYNAGVLLAVLDAGVPDTMQALPSGGIDQHYRLHVDGRLHRLAEIRTMAIESSGGDMRVLFALCDASIGSPPLYDQPFRAVGLDDTLRRVAQRAMNNHRIVTIDHEHQQLLLSVDLARQRDALIAYYRRETGAGRGSMLNVVLHFAGRVRRQWLNTAVGYTEGLIPFDRRLNSWPPRDSADAEVSFAPTTQAE